MAQLGDSRHIKAQSGAFQTADRIEPNPRLALPQKSSKGPSLISSEARPQARSGGPSGLESGARVGARVRDPESRLELGVQLQMAISV
jgi:hypothetical protein